MAGTRFGFCPTLVLCFVLSLVVISSGVVRADEPVSMGTRLEPLVDGYLIARLDGSAQQQMHHPTAQEVALVTGEPWEGNTSAYYTILRDGDSYRMYYRGSHFDTATRKATHREVTCYAESKDGVHWTKPSLGLFEFEGSKENNIVWDGIGTHCFTPFLDSSPQCPPEARYKALSRGRPGGKKGLYAFTSPDGIAWKLAGNEPVITEGAFDSQNLAFYDLERRMYVAYFRGFKDGVRDILTCTSPDFVAWTAPRYLDYSGAPHQHLYTNAIRPYPRAPQLLIGFPTRFDPKTQQVEPTLMTSRDGLHFHRWIDALIPHDAPEDRDGNRSNYMGNGLVQLPGDETTFSIYATEAYYTGPDSRIRRFTIRKDGFVSISAKGKGSLITKPLTFDGKRLVLNIETRPEGSVRVAVMGVDGERIEGFELDSCEPLTDDAIQAVVEWSDRTSLDELTGQPVVLQIELVNADLYSIQFTSNE